MTIKTETFLNPSQLKIRNIGSWKKAYQYAKLMEEGTLFPPVKIFFDDHGQYIYNDGIHRVMASKLTGLPLKVIIVKNTQSKIRIGSNGTIHE